LTLNRKTLFLSFVCLALACLSLADEKRTLKPSDYALWETLQRPAISNDGHWFGYAITVVDGDGYSIIRNVDTPQKWMTMFGSGPVFSDDSKWAAYGIGVSKRESDLARDQTREIHFKMGLRNLQNGEELVLDDVLSFRFLKGSHFLVAQRYRGPGRTEGGSDLFIANMADGTTVTLGNVAGFVANKAETLLALDVESDSKNNGVQIYEPSTQRLNTLVWGKDHISNLSWAAKKDAIAFLKGTPDEKKEGDWNTVVLATNVSTKPEITGMDVTKVNGFPSGKRIAEFGGFAVNDDASAIAFGIKNWQDKKGPGKPEEKPGVDVWHWKDLDIQPQQKTRAPIEVRRTSLCIWRPADNGFIQVTDDKIKNAAVLDNLKYAVLYDDNLYRKASTNGIQYQDISVLDLANAQRKQVLTKTQWGVLPSRKGNYLAYYKDKNWWVYDIASGSAKNVTGTLGATFEDMEDDHTVPERPMANSPTWLANDKGLIVGTRYDRWLIEEPSGKTTKLTDGEKDHMRFTQVDAERGDDGIQIDHPIYFNVLDESSKKAGFYVWRPGVGGKMLILADKSFNGLIKSKDTDRMIFGFGSFTESPNVYVTNTNFDQSKPLTHTNPQQSNFLWGKTQLVTYKSKWGKPLSGFLIYPADYHPGKKYPMITYIYERLSDGINNYVTPVDWSSYNAQVLSQNGYFIFEPDIAYHGRNPGLSAVECLEPAVDAALKVQPDIDAAHVGLMGHSWGAYQTTFVITQSKKFAAAVAGAPLTELKSMYLSVYNNSGTPDQELLETGQGRLEVPFWEDQKTYEANSPVYQAQKITAPLMIAQGTADGAVDFHQGMYMFNTMRRLGKECIFLVYEGENHSLAKRPNQLDYAHRLRHFFDVYLKGAKPESWVTDGVPFLKKDG
jgi:dipeptidyl aminopeptidase/acylaminoacyl peptidase